MNREDAEEFTQALGQIVGGSWRQIALAKRLGVPKALGLTTEEWVRGRLGGYVRLSVEERREAVRELAEAGMSQREISDVLGVTQPTIMRDMRVERNVSRDGGQAMQNGQVKFGADTNVSPLDAIATLAADERLRTQAARMQREAARKSREEADREAAAQVNPEYVIHHAGIDDVTPGMLPDASVDAVITDPPYPQKFLPLFSSLSRFAARVLKPGGWCITMTGNTFLPEVVRRLGEQLEFRWQYVVTTPGGPNNRNPALGLFQAYKPVLIYQKPPISKMREWWPDVVKLETVDANEKDKALHKWQQPQLVFDELVRRFTVAGGLVVDPFAGSGTTGRAAVSQGRHFWGCDIDARCATTPDEKRKLKEMLG